jgi:hypothetical protein
LRNNRIGELDFLKDQTFFHIAERVACAESLLQAHHGDHFARPRHFKRFVPVAHHAENTSHSLHFTGCVHDLVLWSQLTGIDSGIDEITRRLSDGFES